MRQKIIAGNWKMNGSQSFIGDFASQFQPELPKLSESVKVVLAPPAVYLQSMSDAFSGSNLGLGAQNVSQEEKGAFTGEISASMLTDLGVEYCLVGHSERRELYSETDQMVVSKVAQLIKHQIIPVLCVGETLVQRESDQAEVVVRSQLEAVLSAFSDAELATMIIAYEPVWAIGTGKTATPEIAQTMHAFIRSVVAEKSAQLADRCTVLYGGSVSVSTAVELFGQSDIDGGLVGGASLKADDFKKICESMG
jgi:triosephosphate isomerase